MIPRIGHLELPTGVDFDTLLREVNEMLFNRCKSPEIMYKSHDGFWTTPIHEWNRDGIHPNTNLGRALYKKSIRQNCTASLGPSEEIG